MFQKYSSSNKDRPVKLYKVGNSSSSGLKFAAYSHSSSTSNDILTTKKEPPKIQEPKILL